MKNSLIITLLSVSMLVSCDFIDDKLSAKNNSDSTFIVNAIYFENENDKGVFYSTEKIKGKDEKILGVLNRNWKNIMKNSNDDSFIRIMLISKNSTDSLNQLYLDKDISLNEYDLMDSLIYKGIYLVKDYDLKDLNRLKWQITYPDDGFKKGEKLEE